MAQVSRTFVIPEITSQQTPVNNPMNMQSVGGIPNALMGMSSNPKKTKQVTVTTTDSMPRALADMIARRNTIGATRQSVADSLRMRETPVYGVGSLLTDVPETHGYGSGASDFVRGFGRGLTQRADAAIDRAKSDYTLAEQDLARALAYDVAMGNINKTTQEQDIGYGGNGADALTQYFLMQQLFK